MMVAFEGKSRALRGQPEYRGLHRLKAKALPSNRR